MKIRKSFWVAALALPSLAWLMPSHAQNAGVPGNLPGRPAGDVTSTEAASLVATLEMVKSEPQLRLTVENRGTSTVRLLRLRPGWLEYNGGSLHNWRIQIKGPGGDYQFPIYLGFVPLAAEKDFIELAPGEAFSTLIKVSEASRYEGAKRYHLPQTVGICTVTVSHDSLRSNALNFTTGNK